MKNQTKNRLTLQITKSVAIVAMATLFSCKNDISEVARVNQPDTLPSMYAREVKIAESEAGRIKYNLTAPILKRYESNQGAVIKFPEGFKVVFYDSLQPDKIRTEITAEFGINNEAKKTMEASKNVIVINHLKGEKLNTEHLVWDQNTKKVYSEKFVTITTPDKILYGEGMESDEKFERWSIKKPRGEMYINEDK